MIRMWSLAAALLVPAAAGAQSYVGSAMRRRDERREQAQEAPDRAFAACMEGRGYSVR